MSWLQCQWSGALGSVLNPAGKFPMKHSVGGVLFSLVPLEFGSERHGREPAAEPGLSRSSVLLGGTLRNGERRRESCIPHLLGGCRA